MVNRTFSFVISLCLPVLHTSTQVEADELQQLLQSGEYVQALEQASVIKNVGLRRQQMFRIARHQAASGVPSGALSSISLLQQLGNSSLSAGRGQSGTESTVSGGQGGAAMADFDTLIDLIKATVAPDSWDDLGGAGTITPFPGGVYVDQDGLMVPINLGQDGELRAVHREQFEGMFSDKGQDIREHSSVRKVSLVRLQRQLELLQLQGKRPDESMRNLAGIYKIQYVLVFPEQGDIVVAGPAGPWQKNANGRVVNINNGKPVLKLDYLVELMRNAYSDNPTFGCSITPRSDNLLKAKQYLANRKGKSLTAQNTDAWLERLRQLVGRQDVEVFGTDNQTQLAQVLVEADRHMKLIGLGEVAGIAGMNSYLDNAAQSDEPAQTVNMLRWWFTTNYHSLHASKDGLAYEIVGPAIKVLSENEIVDKLGNRRQTGSSDPLSQQFAAEFTRHFEEIAERYPVYLELRNVFDLAVVSMLINAQQLDRKVGWDANFYTQPYGYQPARAKAANSVEPLISHRITKNRVVLAAISGGVLVDPRSLVTLKNIRVDDYGILNAEYQGNREVKLPGNTWWWD
ncbi:MAG: hypothetical protein CMJ76_15880 [Planctomycetaceae bacterium]|nr:hypothetical protein [Planctomycetaceae bacterium]